jgi:hypothetical protein
VDRSRIVAEPLTAYGLGSRRERRERVNSLLELVGLDPKGYGRRRPRELSGGAARRPGHDGGLAGVGRHRDSGRARDRQTLKPSARSCSRPSSVILSGPHGGSHTQLIRKSATSPSSAECA